MDEERNKKSLEGVIHTIVSVYGKIWKHSLGNLLYVLDYANHCDVENFKASHFGYYNKRIQRAIARLRGKKSVETKAGKLLINQEPQIEGEDMKETRNFVTEIKDNNYYPKTVARVCGYLEMGNNNPRDAVEQAEIYGFPREKAKKISKVILENKVV